MAKEAVNRKKAAKEFAVKWCGRGDEKQDTQVFWTSLLRDVFGVANPEDSIQFEKRIKLRHTSFIDAYIPETKVLIEQKSVDVDLRKEARQSDGTLLTPYRQAKRYADEMPNSLRPNWIVVCNFREFLIYDMEKPHDEPVQVLLEDLPDKFECLQFMVNYKKTSVSPEEQISLKAGELVGKLYDALYKEYINPDESSLRSLNILCVRIVFCLYAEDAGLFETRTAFEDYIKSFSVENLRDGIIKLFKVLDTKPENRDKYDTKINSFPYVNGGLFADDTIEIPNFTKEIVDVLVNFCAPFDWSEISPTIFGAVFESTLNPETRRKGGMHYTSIENIHKVIDPLFMDDLRKEFCEITGIYSPSKIEGVAAKADGGVCCLSHTPQSSKISAKTRSRLEQFRSKLANLKFLDPACGSGNFLTETYISLRRLENEILKNIYGTQMFVGHGASPIKVKISQFYGIEINDFAVTVAKTALWIAESQMMKETEEIVNEDLDFLPLSTSATIVEGNALRMDWSTLSAEKSDTFVYADKLNVYAVGEPKPKYGEHYKELNVVAKEVESKELPENIKNRVTYDYIIGNPPFVGYGLQSEIQKEDTLLTYVDEKGKTYKSAGKIDYVANWYFKAAKLISGTKTSCAFVSTNSITQGEQVASVWKPIFERFKIHIDFAYRTFKWANETTDKKNMAAVHCVIIGFSSVSDKKEKRIFTGDKQFVNAENISPYLIDSPTVWLESRLKPLSKALLMTTGNRPADGGHLIIEEDEYEDFVRKEPDALKYIKNLTGAEEYINNKKRYCLWLVGATPVEIRSMKEVYKRVQLCRDDRLNGAPDRQKLADTPSLFRELKNPEKYIIVPATSSENRRYIPLGFLGYDTIPTNSAVIIPDAGQYEFGILTSSVHMAWMRAVAGRLEMRYRYSKDIVYNNFPWCNPSEAQKAKIEQTAQAILDARALFPEASLADLYDETTMPPELRKAHKENDKAVMQAYGFDPKMSESEIVAELFKMYENLCRRK